MERQDEQEQRTQKTLSPRLRRSTSSSEVQYTPPGSEEEEEVRRSRPGGTKDPKPPKNPQRPPTSNRTFYDDSYRPPSPFLGRRSLISHDAGLSGSAQYGTGEGSSGTPNLTTELGRLWVEMCLNE